jgi:hypothetical protein
MDATELFRHKQAFREMIRDAVNRRDSEHLRAVSTAVHDLELELLESAWQLDQLAKGVKHSSVSRVRGAILQKCEVVLGGYSVFFMAWGVSLAWRAARIRSRLKGEPVYLDFEKTGDIPLPLDL